MTRSVSCHLPLREGPQSSGRCWPCPGGTSTSEAAMRRLLDGTDTFRVERGSIPCLLVSNISAFTEVAEVGGHLSPHTLALRGAGVKPCALQQCFRADCDAMFWKHHKSRGSGDRWAAGKEPTGRCLQLRSPRGARGQKCAGPGGVSRSFIPPGSGSQRGGPRVERQERRRLGLLKFSSA